MARLSICLLGSFEVTLEGEPVTGFASDKVRALLAYLVVESDRAHRREALAGLLWPGYPDRSARTNLRRALANLRKTIGDRARSDGRDADPPVLRVSRQTIQFDDTSDTWCDVTAFTRMLEAEGPSAQAIDRLAEAVEWYRGGFLEGFSIGDSAAYGEWMLLKREQLRRQALAALHRLAAHHEEQGEYESALPYAWRQVELEPWQEEAQRQLMRLLALGGQPGLAVAQYEACRRALSEELDVEPAQETVRLYERIRDGELAPPPRSPAPPIDATASPEAPQARQPGRRAMDKRLILVGAPLLLIAVIVGAVLLFAGWGIVGGQTPRLTFHPPPLQEGEGKVVDLCEDMSPPQICVSHLQPHRVVQATSYLTFDQVDALLSWSPDGHQIVFAAGANCTQTYHGYDLYIIRADGSDLRQITDSNAHDTSPIWSPDGQWIAFGRDGALWVVHPDGSAPREIWDEGSDETRVLGMGWSMDSRRVAFLNTPHSTENPTFSQLWSIDPEGRAPLLIHTFEQPTVGGMVAWSPDGQQIVCLYALSNGQEPLYIIDVNGGGELPHTNTVPIGWFHNFWPQWGIER